MSTKPFLIITNGPTGSGKSGLVTKVINRYNLSEDYTKLLIDDLVENNDHYKDAIDNYIQQTCDSKRELCDALSERLKNPDDDTYRAFGDMYFETREGYYCGAVDEKAKCSDWLDGLLGAAISQGQNIVFETVGTHYVDWLIKMLKGREYRVIYAFTLLDFCENVRRNKIRASSQMEDYIKDRTKPAPRLPDVREESFKMTVNKIGQNLMQLMGRKLFGQLDDVESIIVFNNTNRLIEVLYDSDTTESMSDLVR